MKYLLKQSDNPADRFREEIIRRSDNLMNYFLLSYFGIGLLLAVFYGTWLIAFGIGGILLIAYYSAKFFLPYSNLYQYVLSAVFGIFMAQFIYEMHGLFEMHFLAFIGSAILITYQNWKLQIPILIVVFIHHAIFSYLQNIGLTGVYFTQLNYFELQTFIIHMLLTIVIFFICGLWAYQLKKCNEILITQALQMAELQKEAQLSIEREENAMILRKLNENLRRQAKELVFSNSELEQFAYVASHDLQEPLRMITGFLNLIEKRYSDIIDNKGKQYIYYAVDGAQRMRQIIYDLLDFSRVGRTEDKLEKVNFQSVVTDIIKLYKNQVEEQHADIIFNNLPTLQTFKAPIRQVFQNLIANGLKYQASDNKPVIGISYKEFDNQWLFSVQDNGIGIDPEHFNKIFVIFQRLHNREKYAGTGMGLAVTKKIIENLGGKIWVESEEGKGSIFHFTLPK
jgi:two-component system, sensor histidine kinase and response regulator